MSFKELSQIILNLNPGKGQNDEKTLQVKITPQSQVYLAKKYVIMRLY